MCVLVSIIIPTYKDWNRLTLCLKALELQSFPSEDFEVIVVDNETPHSVPNNFLIPHNARIIHEPLSGSYAARNKALSIATGDLLAFTDSDCIPDRDWVLNIVKKFKDNPEVSRIAGKVELFYANPNTYTLGEAYEMIFAFRQEDYSKNGRSVTANMIARRTVFDGVGNFNAKMISGGDFEWANRATSYGFSICYEPNIIVKHPARADLKQILNKRKRVASHAAHSQIDNPIKKYMIFFYGLRPPLKDLKKILYEGKKLSVIKKFTVFFIRYYSNIVFAYSQLRASAGKIFDDKDMENKKHL